MKPAARAPRILIAKPGLDGHTRGIYIILRALREAGFEVIYTGIRVTPEEIAAAAVQEDVAAVGLSCLSGAHLELFPAVSGRLKKAGLRDLLLFCGGTIPPEDVAPLRKAGFKGVFPTGSRVAEIVEFLRSNLVLSSPNILATKGRDSK